MAWTLPETPKVASSAIVEYKDGIVLIDRKYPPLGFAIPGGFHEFGLSLEENTIKEVKEETGLDGVIKNPTKPIAVMSHPQRDPRGQVIDVIFVVEGSGTLQPHEDEDAKEAILIKKEELKSYLEHNKEKFAFPEHAEVLKDYLDSQ